MQNDAQKKIFEFLWKDYTEGRQGHARITGEEYRGYRALLEAQDGLFLVDIGNGNYDTYLSYADIEALTRVGVPKDRTVRVHPSQHMGATQVLTLQELKRKYGTRTAVDVEGKGLLSTSEARIARLRAPLLQSYSHRAEDRVSTVEVKATTEPRATAKTESLFASEEEKILALIESDEQEGKLTHAQAEAYREKARRGELLLVDIGTGEFDTYLSAEDIEELTSDPSNADRSVRLYNTGEVNIILLGHSLLRRQAEKPKAQDTEAALQREQEKAEGQKLDVVPERPVPGIPPHLLIRPRPGGGNASEESSGERPAVRVEEKTPGAIQAIAPVSAPARPLSTRAELQPREAAPMPVAPFQRGRVSGPPEVRTGVSTGLSAGSERPAQPVSMPQGAKTSTEQPPTRSKAPLVPRKKEGGAEEHPEQENLRGGPPRQREAPPRRPRRKRHWGPLAAATGGTAVAFGAPGGLALLSRLGERSDPDLALSLSRVIAWTWETFGQWLA